MFSESVCKGQKQSCISVVVYPKTRNAVNTLLSRRGIAYRPTRASALAPYSPTVDCRGAVQRDCSAARRSSAFRSSVIVIRCFSTAGLFATTFLPLPSAPRAHTRDVCPAVISFSVFPSRARHSRRRRRQCRCYHCHSYRAAV